MYHQQANTAALSFSGIIFQDYKHPGYREWQQEHFHPSIEIDAAETAMINANERFLQRMIAIVKANMGDETFGVSQLAGEIGLCRRQLHRKLRALLNQSPTGFIRSCRLQHAAALIQNSSETFSEIAYKSGFNTPNYFCKVFREAFGCTPKAYRAKAGLISRNRQQKIQWVNG